MRQLGARPPAPPPVETAGETPSEILAHEPDSVESEEPFRVEVYRLERKPIVSKPVDLQEAEVSETHAPVDPQVPEPTAPKEKEEVEVKEETNDTAAPVGDVPQLHPHEQYPVEVHAPVEVHRIELNPVAAEPAARPQQATKVPYFGATSPAPAISQTTKEEKEVREGPKEAVAPLGRWEEFREPGRSKPGRGDRIHLERVPLQQGFSSRLLTADLEREPGSPFLILAVLGIGAALVVGALWWKGWIPTHVKQPDAAMIALQEQNRKLADALAERNVKPPTDATSAPQNGATLPQPKTAQEEHPGQSGHPGSSVHRPNPSERLQGVSVPPPMRSPVHGQRRSSTPQKGSLYDRPPEIVPPYPTLAQSQNAGAGSQPAPDASAYGAPFTPGAYQQPVPAARAAHPGMSPSATSHTAPPPAAAPKPPAPSTANNNSSPALTLSNGSQYDAGIGSYANLLAQNVETVEGLQRHSPVQLREFHARAGVPTQATRTVRLSVQHPDQSSGSYALVVAEGGSSYQLRGEVNVPLGFADTATHRRYGLVILSIAGQQVYGYVRAMQ